MIHLACCMSYCNFGTAGFPEATQLSGILRVTTELAPITEPLPIRTLGITKTPAPSIAPSSMRTKEGATEILLDIGTGLSMSKNGWDVSIMTQPGAMPTLFFMVTLQ